MHELDADVVAHMRDEVLDGIRALKARPPARASAPEREARAVWATVVAGGLSTAVMATRPYSSADPAGSEIELYWLLPLALAIAECWRVAPADKRTLAAHSEDTSWVEAKVALVMRAVSVVQSSRDEATTLKIGRAWVTDAEGKKAIVQPGETLDYVTYLRWFVARTIREARNLLHEEAGLTLESELLEESVATELDSALELLIHAEDATQDRASVTSLYTAARDETDRALLDAIANGSDSLADAARSVGLTPGAGKQRLRRLRLRARPA